MRFHLTPQNEFNFWIVLPSHGLKIFLSQMMFLPILAHWTKKDMVNVEGTMVSLLLSLNFLTLYIGKQFGYLLMMALKINKETLNSYWQLIACQAVY